MIGRISPTELSLLEKATDMPSANVGIPEGISVNLIERQKGISVVFIFEEEGQEDDSRLDAFLINPLIEIFKFTV